MIPSDKLIVSQEEPTGSNRRKVWIQNTDTDKKMYIKNNNNVYEEYIPSNIGIETITNDDGTAYKFSNGLMIVTQMVSKSTTITNKQNVVYTSDTITLPDFPVPFVSTPIVQRSLEKDDSVWFCWLTTKAKASKTNPGTILLVRDGSTASTGIVDFSVSVVAIGRWKDETSEKEEDNTNGGEISQ